MVFTPVRDKYAVKVTNSKLTIEIKTDMDTETKWGITERRASQARPFMVGECRLS